MSTAYCFVCRRLRPFEEIGEVTKDISPESTRSLQLAGARIVAIEFDCGSIAQIVTTATEDA